jgi:hypothetical protein
MASAMPLPTPTVKSLVIAQIPTQARSGPRHRVPFGRAAESPAASTTRVVEVALTAEA